MLIRFLTPRRYYNAETGGGTGGTGGTGGQGGSQGNTDQQTQQTQSLQNLLARNNGDAMAMAAQLFNDNYALRERNRQLQGVAPAEGSVVLTKDQATAWQAYTALGAPDALSQQVQAAQTAAQELATLKRGSLLRDVAAVQGWDADVLGELPGAADLEFSLRDVTVDGKVVKTALVKPKDGAEIGLAEYATQKWAKFLPALAAQQQQQQGGAPKSNGTPFPGQQGGQQQGGPASPVAAAAERFQKQRDAAPSPLAAFGKK